ncbi:MAG TPA: PKD domain-containing protein [Bacteroidia bacterium]|nr:PKD domain-containing protein [Bacteroidia bacterium]
MKKLIIASILFLNICNAFAQTFIKIIPNNIPFDFVYSGIYTLQAPQGEYIMATTVNDSAGSNIMIIKLNSAGEIILHNELLQPLFIETATNIMITQANEFVIGGAYNVPNTNYDDELLMAKTDLKGNQIFMKNLTSSGICCWDFATGNIFETANHNYIVGGEGFGISSINGYAKQTDSAGNNMQTFSLGSFTRTEAIVENSAGEIIMGGKDFQLNQAVLTKRDANTNFKWTKTYNKGLGGTVKNTSIMEIIQLPTGFLLAAKYPNPTTGNVDLWMIETDLNGDTIKTNTFANDGNIIGMKPTYNGYAVAVIDSNNIGGYDFKIIFLDNNYNKISQRNYGTLNIDVLYSFEKCSDGGFVMSGLTYDNSFIYNALVIKTDSLGCVAPAANFTWQQASLANNQSGVDFTNTTLAGIIDTNATYLWNFGDNTFSTIKNPQHIYASQGTYIVTLTVTTQCGVDSVQILVTATCTGTYNYFTHASSLLSATFNDPDPSATSWNWNFGDNTFSAIKNPSHTYAATGTYYVCLTKFNTCGSFTMCDSVKIECPAPLLNIGSDKTVCQGQNVILDAGNPGMNYLWSNGASTKTISVNTSGTYIVTVTNSCNAFSNDTVVINFITPPVLNFGSDTTVCMNDTITFQNSAQPGFSYQWFVNSYFVTSQDSLTYAFNQIGSNDIKVIATNLGCIDSAQIKVDVNPIAMCTGVPLTYCIPTYTNGTTSGDYIKRFGVNTLLNVTGSQGGPAYNDYTNLKTDITGNVSYTWTFEFSVTNAMLSKMWIDFNMDGTFDEPAERVYLQAANNGITTANFSIPTSKFFGGLTRLRLVCADVANYNLIQPCGAYDHGETEDYTLNLVNPFSPPISNFMASDSTIKLNDAVNFFHLASNNATGFNWTFTGATPSTSTAANPANIVYPTSGCYQVSLTATNANGNDAETKICFIDVANNIGMQEVTSNALEIYTGNNNGDFYIFNPNMDATTVTVYDCMGKIIFTENTSEQKINLSLANHKVGIYFIIRS